jgi:hypothetical protein
MHATNMPDQVMYRTFLGNHSRQLYPRAQEPDCYRKGLSGFSRTGSRLSEPYRTFPACYGAEICG